MPTHGRVLVIDDDPQALDTARLLLQQAGFEVVTYSGHFNRLNFVLEHKPDLVLLDVNMPFLSGDELLRLFKDHVDLRRVPVVFFSSNDETSLRLMVVRCGALGYIPKSEMAGDFGGKVRRYVERARLAV